MTEKRRRLVRVERLDHVERPDPVERPVHVTASKMKIDRIQWATDQKNRIDSLIINLRRKIINIENMVSKKQFKKTNYLSSKKCFL